MERDLESPTNEYNEFKGGRDIPKTPYILFIKEGHWKEIHPPSYPKTNSIMEYNIHQRRRGFGPHMGSGTTGVLVKIQ